MMLGYIAGFASRKLSRTVRCEECLQAISCDSIDTSNKMIIAKNYGGLTSPAKSIVFICKVVETVIRGYHVSGRISSPKILPRIELASMRDLVERKDVFPNMLAHAIDQSPLNNHRNLLIKSVIFQYASIRLYHWGKMATEELQQGRCRSINTKVVLFKGQ